MPAIFTGRTADQAVDAMFLNRWSPRAFTGEAIPDEVLMSLFEAARWAPSAFNGQPWRFVYAHRDTPQWIPLFGTLMEYNQDWVKHASALIYVISDRFRRKPGEAPSTNRSHSFDAGAAWAYLALQAHLSGWAAHGIGGFHGDQAHAATGVPESDYRIECAIAVGRVANKSVLPEKLQAREVPSGRIAVPDFAFEGRLPG